MLEIFASLITGLVSGYAVYCFTKRREENRRIFQFWEDFLYQALGKCEMYIPIEEIREKSKIDKKDSEWDKAITAIWDQLNPYGHKNIEFSDKQEELSRNVIIALTELYKWGKSKRI